MFKNLKLKNYLKIENLKFKISTLILVLIITVGGFLRFYNLNWGEGLFTHPDEYHIVTSVMQLSFPNQMNPHFFSYGTVTIYLIYFTKQLSIISYQLSGLNPFLIGRFYSALFSTLTIFLVYKISQKIMNKSYALLATLLVALTPGLIQQAHFATPESNLIFFLFGSLLFLLNFIQTRHFSHLFLSSLFLGLSLAVKISGAVFLFPLALGIFLVFLKTPISLTSLISLIFRLILSLAIILTAFFIGAPFVFLDFPAFQRNFDYEGSLAAGTIAVFYTRQFIATSPIIFQLTKIFPYALGPALLFFGILGFFLSLYLSVLKIFKKVTSGNNLLLIILAAFLATFLPNAFLFAKWTRFVSPTFPFFAIFSAFLLFKISPLKLHKSFSFILYSLFLILNLLWSLAFFSVYTNHDIRITASEWIESSITPGSTFLVEGGNMVDLPLEGNFKHISLDFYNLEEDQTAREKVARALEETDYFIVQSRRVFLNHQRLPKLFPKTAGFYDSLFDGKLGFTEIKSFTSYPSLQLGNWKWEIPDESAEETWSVFDHPVIRVFKKIVPLTTEEYTKTLGD